MNILKRLLGSRHKSEDVIEPPPPIVEVEGNIRHAYEVQPEEDAYYTPVEEEEWLQEQRDLAMKKGTRRGWLES